MTAQIIGAGVAIKNLTVNNWSLSIKIEVIKELERKIKATIKLPTIIIVNFLGFNKKKIEVITTIV